MRRLVVLFVLSAAACAPSVGSTETVPTLTLIPVTETPTATPAPPTAEPNELPAPQDVIGATVPPTAEPTAATTDEPLTGTALLQRDPIAAEMVGIAQRMVANQLDLPTVRVRLVDVRAAQWTDTTLNCPLPSSTPVPVESRGYRIVLRAGDQSYILHTDFDRVIRCDAANEQLPPGLLPAERTDEPTVEVTIEATGEAAAL